MTPIEHFQARKVTGMSIHSELLLDLASRLLNSNVMPLIQEAINMEIATSNTLHASLMWLKEHFYIEIVRSGEDAREKKCLLTKKGKYYLEQL